MKVSVIIPCYNVDNYIEECLDSVFKQSYKEIEVIAVDNNSTDDTLDKLIRYKKEKHNELIVLEEKTKGAPAARNKGLFSAVGVWLQFLDADDLLMPKKIEHQIKLIDSNSSNHLFVAGAYSILKLDGERKDKFASNDAPLMACFKKELGITSSNLWSKKALLRINGWNEKLKSSQEADLMFRLLKNDENVLIDAEPLTIVREREAGQISNNSLENKIRYLELRLEMLDYIRKSKSSLYDKEWYQLYRIVYNWARVISRADRKKGAFFYQYIPKKFQPNESLREKIYKNILDIFGFERVEYFRQYISKNNFLKAKDIFKN